MARDLADLIVRPGRLVITAALLTDVRLEVLDAFTDDVPTEPDSLSELGRCQYQGCE